MDSTNEVAKAVLAEGAAPWTVVVAEKQVEGKGRFGRRWASPRGGLYLSVILQEDLSRLPIISLVGGLAVVDALRALGVEATLKWPNDVLVGRAKVAGVLAEGVVGLEAYWAILGIGINSDFALDALPRRIRLETTTLRQELGKRIDNDALLETVLESLREDYPAVGAEKRAIARYREMCSTLGKNVTVETATGVVEGRASGVNDSGFLLVETKKGYVVEVADGSIQREG